MWRKSPAFGSVVIKLSDKNVIYYIELKPGNSVNNIMPEDITLPNTEDSGSIIKKENAYIAKRRYMRFFRMSV